MQTAPAQRYLGAIGAAASIALVSVALLLGCAASDRRTAQDFATPQETFDAAQCAMLADDFTAFTECFTADGLDELAGSLRGLGGLMYAMGSREDADQQLAAMAQDIKAAFDKYLPTDAPEMNLDLNLPESKLRAQIRAAGHALSDRRAFVVAVLQALATHGDKKPDKQALAASHLEDLKVDGDRATATISFGFIDGQPMPVVFRKVAGRWCIEAMGRVGVGP